MKKVKYLGALAAAPAVAMVAAPVANAAVAAPQSAKAVAVPGMPDAGPARCTPKSDAHSLVAASNKFHDTVHFSKNHCVFLHSGLLGKPQSSLSMRTRINKSGDQFQAQFIFGSISPLTGTDTFFFLSSIDHNGTQACGALVQDFNHAKVAFGPVCENL